jgi:hypothetical protein
MSHCLWVLVWPCNSCFILSLTVALASENWYCLMQLGISSLDLQDFILTKLDISRSEGAEKANKKLRWNSHAIQIEAWKPVWSPDQFGQNRRPVPVCRYSGNCGHLICTREMHCKSEASDGGLITIKLIVNAKNEEPYLFSKLAPLFFSP